MGSILIPANNNSGGTPAGNDREVQFNDGGAFGADVNFTFAANAAVRIGKTLTATSYLSASGAGAQALGYVYGYNGGVGTISATGPGANAHGSVYANPNYASTIGAGGGGTLAGGYSASFTAAAGISASAYGALAHGYANSNQITASGKGSVALGTAKNNAITASAVGSFAFGYAVSGDIIASAFSSMQVGQGTNAQGTSISVGGGIRINDAAAPSTPRNGDIWVASGYVYVRSNGNSVKIV